jgi:hypothetical protein
MSVQPLLRRLYILNTINNTTTSYSIIRKWIVKDACGNTSEFIQGQRLIRTDCNS